MSAGAQPSARGTDRAAVAIRSIALSRIAEVFAEKNVRWAALKGSDLAWRSYPSPVDREMSDIDVLVDPDRLDEAAAALLTSGFAADANDAGHHLRFRWKLGALAPISVEVHRGLFEEPHGLSLDTAGLLARSTSVRLPSGEPLPVLAAEDAWIHVAGHFAYSDVAGVSVRRALLDLELLARSAALSADPLVQRASAVGLLRAIALVLEATGKELTLTDPILRRFAAEAIRFRGVRATMARAMLRRRIARALLDEPAEHYASAMRLLLAPTRLTAARMAAAAVLRATLRRKGA